MGGYHRYFSHRSFKTSRAMQFFLAFLGCLGAHRGALWWASHHRNHHRYSDTQRDIFSPLHRSFYYAHTGWALDAQNAGTDLERVPDLAKFPELCGSIGGTTSRGSRRRSSSRTSSGGAASSGGCA